MRIRGKRRNSFLMKLASCVVAIAFIMNFVLTDAWAVIPVGASGPVLPAAEEISKLDVETFFLPPDLGTVKYSKKSDPNKVLVHIQDAHCNYEAQKKVFQIIKFLKEEYGIDTVNLEGGVGDYDLTAFEIIPDEVRRDEVGDYFVEKGLINGAELFAIENPGQIKLWGVEDKDLYLKNLEVYRESLVYADKVDDHLKAIKHILSNLKRNIYSDELLEIDGKYMAFKGGDIEFKAYLKYLLDKSRTKRINIKKYANVYLLSQSLEQEENIDFKEANKEREMLIDNLEGRLSPKEMRELLKKTIQFKAKKISQFDFYEFLIKSAKRAGYKMDDYPELQKFIIYVSLYNAVDKFRIMQELDKVESALKQTLYENYIQPELDELSKHLVLIENMFDIRFTKDDYRYYKENIEQFGVANFVDFIRSEAPKYKISAELDETIMALDEYRERIFEFYEYSFERDTAFIDNIKMADGEVTSGILVSGGFHTENLCELFEEKGMSYISIIPTFKNPKGYQSPYFTLLSGKLDSTMRSLKGVFAGGYMMQLASMLTSLADGVWGGDTVEAFRAWVFIEGITEGSLQSISVNNGMVQVTYEDGSSEELMSVTDLQEQMLEQNVDSMVARAREQRANIDIATLISEMRRIQQERDASEAEAEIAEEAPGDEGSPASDDIAPGQATIPLLYNALSKIYGKEGARRATVRVEEILFGLAPVALSSLTLGTVSAAGIFQWAIPVALVFMAFHALTGQRLSAGEFFKMMIAPATVMIAGTLVSLVMLPATVSVSQALVSLLSLATGGNAFVTIGASTVPLLLAIAATVGIRSAIHRGINSVLAPLITSSIGKSYINRITSNTSAQKVFEKSISINTQEEVVIDNIALLRQAARVRRQISQKLSKLGLSAEARNSVIEKVGVDRSKGALTYELKKINGAMNDLTAFVDALVAAEVPAENITKAINAEYWAQEEPESATWNAMTRMSKVVNALSNNGYSGEYIAEFLDFFYSRKMMVSLAGKYQNIIDALPGVDAVAMEALEAFRSDYVNSVNAYYLNLNGWNSSSTDKFLAPTINQSDYLLNYLRNYQYYGRLNNIDMYRASSGAQGELAFESFASGNTPSQYAAKNMPLNLSGAGTLWASNRLRPQPYLRMNNATQEVDSRYSVEGEELNVSSATEYLAKPVKVLTAKNLKTMGGQLYGEFAKARVMDRQARDERGAGDKYAAREHDQAVANNSPKFVLVNSTDANGEEVVYAVFDDTYIMNNPGLFWNNLITGLVDNRILLAKSPAQSAVEASTSGDDFDFTDTGGPGSAGGVALPAETESVEVSRAFDFEAALNRNLQPGLIAPLKNFMLRAFGRLGMTESGYRRLVGPVVEEGLKIGALSLVSSPLTFTLLAIAQLVFIGAHFVARDEDAGFVETFAAPAFISASALSLMALFGPIFAIFGTMLVHIATNSALVPFANRVINRRAIRNAHTAISISNDTMDWLTMIEAASPNVDLTKLSDASINSLISMYYHGGTLEANAEAYAQRIAAALEKSKKVTSHNNTIKNLRFLVDGLIRERLSWEDIYAVLDAAIEKNAVALAQEATTIFRGQLRSALIGDAAGTGILNTTYRTRFKRNNDLLEYFGSQHLNEFKNYPSSSARVSALREIIGFYKQQRSLIESQNEEELLRKLIRQANTEEGISRGFVVGTMQRDGARTDDSVFSRRELINNGNYQDPILTYDDVSEYGEVTFADPQNSVQKQMNAQGQPENYGIVNGALVRVYYENQVPVRSEYVLANGKRIYVKQRKSISSLNRMHLEAATDSYSERGVSFVDRDPILAASFVRSDGNYGIILNDNLSDIEKWRHIFKHRNEMVERGNSVIARQPVATGISSTVRNFFVNNSILKALGINMSNNTYNALAGIIEEPLFRFASLGLIQALSGLSALNPFVFTAWAILTTLLFAKAHPGGIRERSGAYIISAISIAATALTMGYFGQGVAVAAIVASITHMLFNKGVDYLSEVRAANNLTPEAVKAVMEASAGAPDYSVDYEFAQRVARKMLNVARDNADIGMLKRFLNEVPIEFWSASDTNNILDGEIAYLAGQVDQQDVAAPETLETITREEQFTKEDLDALLQKLLTESERLQASGEENAYLDNIIAVLSQRKEMIRQMLVDAERLEVLARAYEGGYAPGIRNLILTSNFGFGPTIMGIWTSYIKKGLRSQADTGEYQLSLDLAQAIINRMDILRNDVQGKSADELSSAQQAHLEELRIIMNGLMTDRPSIEAIALVDNQNVVGATMAAMINDGTIGQRNAQNIFRYIASGLDGDSANTRQYSRGLADAATRAMGSTTNEEYLGDMTFGFVMNIDPIVWGGMDSLGNIDPLLRRLAINRLISTGGSTVGERIAQAAATPGFGKAEGVAQRYAASILSSYSKGIASAEDNGSMLKDAVLSITPAVLLTASKRKGGDVVVNAMVSLVNNTSVDAEAWKDFQLSQLMQIINQANAEPATRAYGEALSNMVLRSIREEVALRNAATDPNEQNLRNYQAKRMLRRYITRVSPKFWRGDALHNAISNIVISAETRSPFFDELQVVVNQSKNIDSARSYAVDLTAMTLKSIKWNLDKRNEALAAGRPEAAGSYLRAAQNLFNVASSWRVDRGLRVQLGMMELMPEADPSGQMMKDIFNDILNPNTIINDREAQSVAADMLRMLYPDLSIGNEYFINIAYESIVPNEADLRTNVSTKLMRSLSQMRLGLNKGEIIARENAAREREEIGIDASEEKIDAVAEKVRETVDADGTEEGEGVLVAVGVPEADTDSGREEEFVDAAGGVDILDMSQAESETSRFYRKFLEDAGNFRGEYPIGNNVMELVDAMEKYSFSNKERSDAVNMLAQVVEAVMTNEAYSEGSLMQAGERYMIDNGLTSIAISNYVLELLDVLNSGFENRTGVMRIVAVRLKTATDQYVSGEEAAATDTEIAEQAAPQPDDEKVMVDAATGVVTIDSKDTSSINEANNWGGVFESVQAVGKEVLDSSSRNIFNGDTCIINIPVSQKMFGKPMAAVLGRATKVRSRSTRMIKVYKLGNITINVFNDTDAGRTELLEKLRDSGVPQQQMVTYMFDQASGEPENRQAQRREIMDLSYAIRLDGEVGETATPIDGCTLAAIKILDHNSRGEMETLEFQESINVIAKALGAIAGISDSATIEQIAKAIVDNGKLRASGMLLIKIRPIDTNEIVEYYEAAAEIMRSL